MEMLRCWRSRVYFARYVQIYDSLASAWIPFDLWPAQVEVLRRWDAHQMSIDLKARQLGLTWLALLYALHGMLFRPIYEALLFSRREDEALHLLERLSGMYTRLPTWMQSRSVVVNSAHHLRLSNGSGARAFPSNAGDSYTATLAIIDEADLVYDLGELLGKVQPTIDAGGKMLLISRADKSRPESRFKQIYRAARQGRSQFSAGFLPWHAHPGRTQAWYEARKASILEESGSLDDLFEQYPATDAEALAGRTLDKRFAPQWLTQCYAPTPALESVTNAPPIPGLALYALPQHGHRYVIGADPAEGNPTSDDSALVVLDADTGEEVAALAGKFQPSVFAGHIDQIGIFFHGADVMCERNNHGHAVLLWLSDHSRLTVLPGVDNKPGWHSTTLGKTRLYDAAADAFRNGETTLRSFGALAQLQSIEGSTLRAPEGEHDDRADAYALALVARLAAAPQWESVII